MARSLFKLIVCFATGFSISTSSLAAGEETTLFGAIENSHPGQVVKSTIDGIGIDSIPDYDRQVIQAMIRFFIRKEFTDRDKNVTPVTGFDAMEKVRELMETELSVAEDAAEEVADFLLSDLESFNENIRYIVKQIGNHVDQYGELTEKESNRIDKLHIAVFYKVTDIKIAHFEQRKAHAATGGLLGFTTYLFGTWAVSKVKKLLGFKKEKKPFSVWGSLAFVGTIVGTAFAGYKAGDFVTTRYVTPLQELKIEKIDLPALRKEILSKVKEEGIETSNP